MSKLRKTKFKMALPRKKTVAEEKDDNGGFIDVEQVSTKKSRLQPAMEYSFGFPELLFVLVSIISFIVDIATDIIVTREYVQDTEYLWAGLTIGLILLPSIVMQIFSCIWYINDSDMTWWKWLIHGFQLSPLFRYINVIKTGIVAQRTKEIVDFQRLYHKQNDACMLRLFEAFLESAPQLILQMYIMLTTDGDKTWTAISAAVSLFSLSWSIAAYNKAHRQMREDKNPLSWLGIILQVIWRIGMVSSRVVAILFFASVFKLYIFVVLGAHWLAMLVWIHLQKTDFCDSWCMERLFNSVVAVIYCFCFFNLKESRSRYRVVSFYILMLFENSAMIVIWYIFRPFAYMEWYEYTAMVTVWAGFILGGVSMVIYYRCYHPNHLYLKQCGMVSSEDNTHGANQPRLLYPVDINVKVVDEVQLQNDVAYKEAVGKQTDTNIHNVMMPKGGRDYHGNQSELTSLQSFHLGLSVFTDDLVDHFDNAQLALFDDSVAVKESVSNLRTRSVTNSPLLLKDRLVRKTRSVANSPVLYTCKSDQSYDTSLEPLPNISLGSPPKSTDAEEVRKIYDAILGVCKSKPVSARKLFQSGESLDGSHTSVCKKGSPVPTYDHLARQDKRYYHLDYTAKWNSYRSDESANQSHFNLSSLSKPDVLPSTSHHQPLKMNQMQEVKASQNTTNQNHAVKLPIHQDKSANQNQVIKGSLYKPTNQNQVVKGVLYKPANQIHFVKGVQDKPDYYTQKTRISEKQADKKQRRNYSDKQTSVAVLRENKNDEKRDLKRLGKSPISKMYPKKFETKENIQSTKWGCKSKDVVRPLGEKQNNNPNHCVTMQIN